MVNSPALIAMEEVGSLSQFPLTEAVDCNSGLYVTYWLVPIVCWLPKDSSWLRVQFHKSQISKHKSFLWEAEQTEFKLQCPSPEAVQRLQVCSALARPHHHRQKQCWRQECWRSSGLIPTPTPPDFCSIILYCSAWKRLPRVKK